MKYTDRKVKDVCFASPPIVAPVDDVTVLTEDELFKLQKIKKQ